MKFSYNWLVELTGTSTSAAELGRLITMKTAECEGVEAFAPQLARASVVTVISAEEIPGTHNRKAVVSPGERTVVCGAPNCRPGVRTVWLDVGTKVINGVSSDGMLASGVELGINRDHSGIVELDGAFDLAPDFVIEIDNKSLTHRPDLWGHFGMAREVRALTGSELRDPVRARVFPGAPGIRVVIEDYSLCPRYSALVFENVTVKPSPLWLQYRLEAIGLNPINNIVDVSNYLMAELAQPTHAFDADKIGDTIIVRSARADERIEALNGETYALTPANLLITDASGPIAIGGVIGGGPSAISAGTRRIVFESANFHPGSIRKTSGALKLRTDASMRFEKAQDPLNTIRALERAVELFEQVSPGIRVVGGLADAYQPKAPPAPIALDLAWLRMKLGHEVQAAQVRDILGRLGFTVSDASGETLMVTVPSWRATKDVSVREDLAEEVGRMIGYDNITPRPPMVATTVPPRNEERVFHHRVRELMADEGFTEVYNYSFLSDALAEKWGFDPAAHIRLTNPIAQDQNLMRSSLLPLIGANISENAKHFDQFRLFEIGNEIHKRGEGLPDEVPHLVAVIYAKSGDGVANLLELKRVLECLLPAAEIRQTAARAHEHPARAAEVEGVGRLFELHPSQVETGRAAVLDIDLQALAARMPKGTRYEPVRRYPTSAFDLSVVTELRKPVGEIAREIRVAATELAGIEFLREYSGAPLAEGTKSVSYRVTVGARERTLTSDEITAIRNGIIRALESRGYELRV